MIYFKGQQLLCLAFPICADCGGYFDSPVAPAAHSSHALTQSLIEVEEEEEAILKKGSASINEKEKRIQ